ncbi:T9SS type B sorting domain-containing protein [Hymenobacter rubidus]|uniref:T9SS type B sorting domain-containing protein n=1 Tax=Hymenobacter rubidus TaxID=1441626 RepID=UPI00191CF246|nr:gliding motility-associated C-terminal domain-containing protein [Hymenobacter rubidus]
MLVMGLSLWPGTAQASHIRAGDIQAKVDTTVGHNPRRIFFKMTLYLDISKGLLSSVDQPGAIIFFGDGTSTCTPVARIGPRQLIPGNTDTALSVYYFEHTFTTTGSFTVSFVGENRNDGVLNMSTPDHQSFYISTSISIDPLLGLNHSPVLTAPAVDRGAVGQVFLHNPAAYDADHDSLAFHLRYCQQVTTLAADIVGPPCATGTGTNRPIATPCTNYHYPNDPVVTPGLTPVQADYIDQNGVQTGFAGAIPAIFNQDAQTGQLIWNAPIAAGFYNVAMEVEEWRRTASGVKIRIGVVIRDMQIIVSATANLRPALTIPADLCVVAGQTVTGAVTATDGSSAGSVPTPVTLFAYSGILPPATFVQSQSGPPTARGTFSWRTDCSNVARSPYLVVFKAQDNPTPQTTTNPPLIDEKTWRITVVGPPPQSVRVAPLVATGSTLNAAKLDWDPYVCANAAHLYIYRRLGPGPAPGACETGIPASSGYVRIGTVLPNATSFTDYNTDASGTQQGLSRGQTYCYRIYADFPLPGLGESIASQEVCLTIAGRSAMLTNVDVESTSTTNGQITVRWTQPRAASGAVLGGTPSYVLSRGVGQNPTTFTAVRAPFTNLTDTVYVDNGLNTQDLQYSYRLDFVRTFPAGQGATITETGPTASSVRTTVVPNRSATQMLVSWSFAVPWDNAASTQPTVVYRRTGGTGPYTRLGTAVSTATGGSYPDADPALVKGQTYCYYVQTNGRYTNLNFLSSLLNKSQERCTQLVSPPCTPVLTLEVTNCDSLAGLQEFPRTDEYYTNHLRWSAGSQPPGCDATVASYRVYYRPTPTGRFTLIGTTTQPRFAHTNLTFSGGCYAVQAVAPSTVASDTSNVACQDNCVFFKLPNIFTPNGDAQNNVFRPKNSSPVRSVHFQAFNRWGVKVFENTTTASDPILINWSGGPAGEAGAGVRVSDGIYFYLAQVEFADQANTKRTYKGWVEIIR